VDKGNMTGIGRSSDAMKEKGNCTGWIIGNKGSENGNALGHFRGINGDSGK
jgi:hypothetical protein